MNEFSSKLYGLIIDADCQSGTERMWGDFRSEIYNLQGKLQLKRLNCLLMRTSQPRREK